MADEIREAFQIVRMLDIGDGRFGGSSRYAQGRVPGRVLKLIATEVRLHLPDVGEELAKTIAYCIARKLAVPREFDFDRAMRDDREWKAPEWANRAYLEDEPARAEQGEAA